MAAGSEVDDRFGVFDHYTWQPYPPEVPMVRRRPCSACGAPGEIIRYRHDEIIGPYTAFSTLSNKIDDLVTVYCMACAHRLGYGDAVASGVKPPHLNGLQRWLVHVLDHGDPSPPQV